MLARFFQKSKPISFVSLLVLLFVFVFFNQCQQHLIEVNLWFFAKIFGLFLFFSSFVFVVDFIIYKNRLTANTYYALFVFVIFFGIFPFVLKFSGLIISNLFLLLAFRRLYSLQTRKEIRLKLFDSGFYLGIAFVLYPPTIIFVFLIYVSYFIYINIIDKQLFIPILGFISPIFLLFTYYFLKEDIATFKTLTEINIQHSLEKITNLHLLAPLIFILSLLIIALLKNLSLRQNIDNHRKNSFSLLFIHLILSLLVILINLIIIQQSILFLFFPSAIILGNFLYYLQKNWVREFLFYCLFILSLLPLLW